MAYIVNGQPYYVSVYCSFATRHGGYGHVTGYSSVFFSTAGTNVQNAFNNAMYNAIYKASNRANDSVISITIKKYKVHRLKNYASGHFLVTSRKVKKGRNYYLETEKTIKEKVVIKGKKVTKETKIRVGRKRRTEIYKVNNEKVKAFNVELETDLNKNTSKKTINKNIKIKKRNLARLQSENLRIINKKGVNKK